jgi:hypothetical protein
MTIDANASIGYGFQISEKIISKQNDIEDLIRNQSDFKLCFGGDEYSEDGLKTFIFITESVENVYTWEGGVRQVSFSEKDRDNWDIKLKAWAKTYKISKPKINWYLLTSFH